MPLTVNIPPALKRRVSLPSSKSIANRALLLARLSGPRSSVERLSPCDDTRAMSYALENGGHTVDIGAAGTAMRFLTAYYAQEEGGEHLLTGTERMRQRPIRPLVEALRQLGADIVCTGEEGFPPLLIKGRRLDGGQLSLPADVSSQYISALLMVAPLMRDGLTLRLEGKIISRPYIDMTLNLMRRFGARAAWTGEREISVQHGAYTDGIRFSVESDWSAASYWYEMVALTPDNDVRVTLLGLQENSVQGDAAVAQCFAPLGVRTEYGSEGVTLTKGAPTLGLGETLTLDLTGQPDLAQTIIVACATLRRPFRLSGLRSLRIKETDRVAALQNELRKIGAELRTDGEGTLYIKEYPAGEARFTGTPIDTYNDHRMAMAFAPAALRCPGLCVNDPGVVSKSYPDFWEAIS